MGMGGDHYRGWEGIGKLVIVLGYRFGKQEARDTSSSCSSLFLLASLLLIGVAQVTEGTLNTVPRGKSGYTFGIWFLS